METIEEMRDRAQRCRHTARLALREDFALAMRAEALDLDRRADERERLLLLRRQWSEESSAA